MPSHGVECHRKRRKQMMDAPDDNRKSHAEEAAPKANPKVARRHSTPRWVVRLFEVLIIPLVIGSIGVNWAFFMVGPRVTVFYTFDEGCFTLPSRSRHFFQLFQRIRDLARNQQPPPEFISKEKLSKMRQDCEKSPQLLEGITNTELFDDSMKLFTDLTGSAPSVSYSQVVRFTVTNAGNRTARDISIVPESAGMFEIWPDGHCFEPESQGYTRTKIVIPALQPGEQKYLTFWPDTELSKSYAPATATHADGLASVECYAIYRDGSNFVFSIPWSALIIAATLATIFAVLFIFHRVFGHSSEESNASY